MISPSISFIYLIARKLTVSSKIIEYELNEWRKKKIRIHGSFMSIKFLALLFN